MDRLTASLLAGQYIPEKNKPVSNEKLNFSKKVFNLINTDGDNKISQSELENALVKDLLSVTDFNKQKTNVTTSLSLFDDNDINPNEKIKVDDFLNESGYKAEQWFKDNKNLDVGNPNNQYKGVEAYTKSTLSFYQAKNFIGKNFSDVINVVKNPYDVSFIVDLITYDNERADKGTGPYSPYSAQEVISSGLGVCRDSHALGVTLLKSIGYDAKMFGYSAADNIFHAFPAYQDPQTKKWGAIEYGKVYSSEQLNANSPEEAMLKVRPDALVITEYAGGDNPNERMHTEKIFYTPTSRSYYSFMLDNKNNSNKNNEYKYSAIKTDKYNEINGKFNNNIFEYAIRLNSKNSETPVLDNSIIGGLWANLPQAGFKVGIGGGYMPNMFRNSIGPNETIELPTSFAFASLEGNHSAGLEDIIDSGINATFNSKISAVTTLAVNNSGDLDDVKENVKVSIDDGISSGLSRFNWTPEFTLDKSFDAFGDQDLTLSATYGVDLDLSLMASYYRSGGSGFPVSQ